jgi:hypothetical protein
MSPEAFNIRNIKMTIETTTNMPTRSWFKPTDFVDLGMALSKDEGLGDEGRKPGMADLPFAINYPLFTLHLHP